MCCNYSVFTLQDVTFELTRCSFFDYKMYPPNSYGCADDWLLLLTFEYQPILHVFPTPMKKR